MDKTASRIDADGRTSIEHPLHRHELELTKSAISAAKGVHMLLDGGSGKKVLVPYALSQYMMPSIDIDLLMLHEDALRVFSCMRKEHMIDKDAVLSNSDSISSIYTTYYSPFFVYRDKSLPDTDIFTEVTGVGPIKLTKDVINSGLEVRMSDGTGIKVADIAFTIATSINPLVFTEKRARGTFIALFSNTDKFDLTEIAEKSVVHLRQSVQNVVEVLYNSAQSKDPAYSHIRRERAYLKYEQMLSDKLPNKQMLRSKEPA
ncbi:hypothetical protein M1373_02610 [Candidatus Marsarchaeota archaeon]|nr:hypothetical protein [Candidatus Marsarchaeota archaeon]